MMNRKPKNIAGMMGKRSSQPAKTNKAASVDPIERLNQRMAGRNEGDVYDRLLAAQTDLQRGPHGADKPMSLNASMLAKVAQLRGADSTMIERLIGEKYAERFGDAFLEVLESA